MVILKEGRKVTIPAGTRVTRLGKTTKRERDSRVTIRSVEQTKNGKTKIYWKSHGYLASAVL
jgi:hypothetical protein